MYKKILIPVDLAHADQLEKSLRTAANLAEYYKVPVEIVGITANTPTAVSKTPEAFKQKLDAFAAEQSGRHGVQFGAHAYTSHDPAVEVDDIILRAVADLDADLVVMASHVPTIADYVWPSNGGKIASHAAASVFVVR